MDELEAIAQAVRDLAREIAPDMALELKYGGQVMVPDPANPKVFVGGVFTYKDHVSVEFSDGASLDDPSGHLEGKGKARRHVKLREMADIEGKELARYLRQVLQ